MVEVNRRMFGFMKDVIGPLFGAKKAMDFDELSCQKLNDDGSVAFTLKVDKDGNMSREQGMCFLDH
jgi:hypothetical protein